MEGRGRGREREIKRKRKEEERILCDTKRKNKRVHILLNPHENNNKDMLKLSNSAIRKNI